MQKHEIYQNQQSFAADFSVTKDLSTLSGSFAVVLSEADISSPPAFLKNALSNKVLGSDLQKESQVVYGREGDSYEKVLVLFTKSLCPKTAYKTGRAHYKQISQKLQSEKVHLCFSDSLQQDFLNEYVYGLFLENYQWQRKSQPQGKNDQNKTIFKPVQHFTFVSSVLNAEDSTFSYITKVVKYSLYARELINTRANIANTYWMRDQAQSVAQGNDQVDIELIQGEQLLKKGLTLMHAVGRASTNEPILAVLNYRGDPTNPDNKYAVVGKGVIYDCGGLNLKQSLTEYMHCDKGGACTSLSIFKGVVELGLKVNLVCSLALVENSISANAYRPSDIIETYKGLTVEILNTDAEGRNILADALSYTQVNYKPHTIFDYATLTGACLGALGLDTCAIFSNNEEIQEELIKLSKKAYEPLHPLPITDYMRDNILSDQGDIRNLGKAPYGGSGTAAAFLQQFIEEGVKWVHIDCAQASVTKGEGLSVRTTIDYYKNLA